MWQVTIFELDQKEKCVDLSKVARDILVSDGFINVFFEDKTSAKYPIDVFGLFVSNHPFGLS